MNIFPSLISADLLNLGSVIKQLNEHVDGYHIDVMDGHFVPNLTWGPAFVHAIATATQLPLHVHLMIESPERWALPHTLRARDTFIFHVEAMQGDAAVRELIDTVKGTVGCKVGIALNPKTPVSTIEPFLGALDSVLVMSVNPGFSGQKFVPEVLSKVTQLKQQREQRELAFAIGIDGGINVQTLGAARNAGVDDIAAATAIFGGDDAVHAVKQLRLLTGV